MNKPKRTGFGKSKYEPAPASNVVNLRPDPAAEREYYDATLQQEMEMLEHPVSDLRVLAEVIRGRQELREAVQGVRFAPSISTLARDRHPQRNFFVADLQDVSLKDDIASMEHPLFALKAGDRRVREYEHKGLKVTVKPGFDGCATIHDKDLWIYCISQLMEAKNRHAEISRTVRFTAYDFLVSTNRDVGGDDYRRLGETMERLKQTTVETNIETDAQRERTWFGLIDSARIIERDRKTQRMVSIEVTLPDWLYRAVQAGQVLTLDRDYFRIRKPLHRRLYELARKHCGHQVKWAVTLDTLLKKSGSTDTLNKFRASIRELVTANDLPGYRLRLDEAGAVVTFYNRKKGNAAQLADALRPFKVRGPSRRHGVRAVTVEDPKKSK
jgi:hypothetical protein